MTQPEKYHFNECVKANIDLLHAYRVLICYKNKDITGKDCSHLDYNKALDVVLNFVRQYLDYEETINSVVEQFKKEMEENL